MNTYAKKLKKKIFTIISEISKTPEEFTTFNPRAFSRKSKWGIQTLMKFILSFESKSLGYEIGKFFAYKKGFPSVSSFVQQRKKLSYTAFEQLFHSFNQQTDEHPQLYKGYRLLAIDGSELDLPYNPNESNCKKGKHVSTLHLNGLFDVMSRVFVDVLVEREQQQDERGSGCILIDRLSNKYPALIIADRNYESYNFFAHIIEKGCDYVIRIKDIHSTGILSGMDKPDTEEFDIIRRVFITRKHNFLTKKHSQKYKYLAKKKRFDFLNDDTAEAYEMVLRFVRFKLSDNTYECLATNLPEEVFTAEDLKEIYRLRWCIETGFCLLKHVVGLIAFHSKQENSILQEIFARLVMHNFSMLIVKRVRIPEKKNLKNELQVNRTQAFYICRHFFTHCGPKTLFNIEEAIRRYLLPVRPNRTIPRTALNTDAIPFNYRLA